MLCFRNSPAAKKSMDKRGGCQDFPSKFLCLKLPKTFAGNLSVLCFRKFLVARKILDKEGVSRSSVESFFV